MSEFHLQTPRLLMRPFAEEDAAGFYQMNADPEVLQFTGDAPFSDESAALAFIRSYDHYEKYGYGRWAVLTQSTGAFIGFCGLKFQPDGNYTDLGFRIRRNQWGRGFATEAAEACIQYAFTDLQLPFLVGRVQKQNEASIQVLEKVGMNRIRNFDFEGRPGYWYELRAEDWG